MALGEQDMVRCSLGNTHHLCISLDKPAGILMLCTDQGIMPTGPCKTIGKSQFAPKHQPQHPHEHEYVEMVLGKEQTLPDPSG